MYYKDKVHEEQVKCLLNKLKLEKISQDIKYGTFAYIVGATYKAKYIMKIIDEDNNIDLDMLYDEIDVYSTSEQHMIRFALQCFNYSIDDIQLGETMRSLDALNTKVIKQAIDIRY